jgi:hypothetical protein
MGCGCAHEVSFYTVPASGFIVPTIFYLRLMRGLALLPSSFVHSGVENFTSFAVCHIPQIPTTTPRNPRIRFSIGTPSSSDVTSPTHVTLRVAVANLKLQTKRDMNLTCKSALPFLASASGPVPAEDVTPQKRTFPVVWSSCQTLTTAVRTSYSAK